jgi:MFS family permease
VERSQSQGAYRPNQVFAAACLGMLLFGIVFLSLGSVNNMLAERFALDDRSIGTLTALLPFGILAGSVIFGPIVDRFGYRWMLVGSALLVGAALEGIATASSKGLVQLFVFAIGFGGGILNGATNALAADVSEGERGAKLSLLGVFFGIGALTMPGAIAVLSHALSLSTIVESIGALVLLPAAYCLAIDFPPAKQRSALLTPFVGVALMWDPFFLFTCLALAIQSGMEGMSNDWMTRYLYKSGMQAGIVRAESDLQLGLVALTIGIVAMRAALAWILKRANARAVLGGSLIMTLCGAVLLASMSAYQAALFGSLLIGCGLAAVFPVMLGYVGDRYPSLSGTAFSTVFVVALLGNMATNKTFGYIAQEYGAVQYPKMMLGLVSASAILLVVATKRINSPLPVRQ